MSGGPPVILYLLSGPDPIEATRANLAVYVTGVPLMGAAVTWSSGVLGANAAWSALALAPAYWAGIMAGTRVFPRFSDLRFRQMTLLLMLGVSAGILLAP